MSGQRPKSDTDEGRTLFIRNLSFNVDHDSLYAFFAGFGPLEFAKVVKDPITQHSRGTGFVKFVNKDDAQRVLGDSSRAENASSFTLENRQLTVSVAVSRQEAEQLRGRQNEVTEEADFEMIHDPQSTVEHMRAKGRNLHLARVGILRAGTVAAEGVSKEDMARREALLRAKKIRLRNPNIFISDVRLCVRNLPLSVTDADLRQACLRLLGTSQSKRITECRVMRNLEPGRQQFRSLGYAFVSFATHEDALKALHGLNNNGDLFPGQRRPIVEFSLENILALEKKRRRAERSALVQSKRSDTPINPSVRRICAGKSRKRTKSLTGSCRLLPKHLGPKKRHSRRACSSSVGQSSSKSKTKRLSRKQSRMKKAQAQS